MTVERVIRNSRPSLQQALDQLGREVPVTDSPTPKAYFRIDGDWLWVRVVMYEGGHPMRSSKARLRPVEIAYSPFPESSAAGTLDTSMLMSTRPSSCSMTVA